MNPVRRLGQSPAAVLTAAVLTICAAAYSTSVALMVIDRGGVVPVGQPGMWEDLLDATVFLLFAIVGVVIRVRRPGDRVGAVCLAIGLVSQVGGAADSWAEHGADAGDPARWARWLSYWYLPVWLWLVGVALALLFPDGRPPTQRWRRLLVISGAITALVTVARVLNPVDLSSSPGASNPTGVPGLETVTGPVSGAVWLIAVFAIPAAASQVVRYRRAGPDERARIRWVATALALASFTTAAGIVIVTFAQPEERGPVERFLLVCTSLGWAAVPLAIGVALSTHRLYAIDTVIDRALVGALLLTAVAVVYASVVIAGSRLLTGQAGGGWWPAAGAAAVVALAFDPLHRRIRAAVDRLVRGRRLPPYEALARLVRRQLHDRSMPADDEILLAAADVVARAVDAAQVRVRVPHAADRPLVSVGEATAATSAGVVSVPIPYGGETLGTLEVAADIDAKDRRLLDDLAAQLGLLIRHADLSATLRDRLAELTTQTAEVRASRQRIVQAHDTERRRLERNLHDGAQQRLLAVSTTLARVEARPDTAPEIATLVRSAADELAAAIVELRELSRGLHPGVLTEAGVLAAICALADRCPVPVMVRSPSSVALPADVQAAVYFVAAETLTNAARYADADQLTVDLSVADGCATLTVTDDGRGGARVVPGGGLQGLHDRVAAAGGTLTIDSPRSAGTIVTAWLPCG